MNYLAGNHFHGQNFYILIEHFAGMVVCVYLTVVFRTICLNSLLALEWVEEGLIHSMVRSDAAGW